MARTATIGEMTEPMTVQQRSTAAGAVTWSTLATIYASIRVSAGGETQQTEAIRSSVRYEIETHYRADITATMRLSWTPFRASSAKTLQINGVRVNHARPDRLILDCTEVA